MQSVGGAYRVIFCTSIYAAGVNFAPLIMFSSTEIENERFRKAEYVDRQSLRRLQSRVLSGRPVSSFVWPSRLIHSSRKMISCQTSRRRRPRIQDCTWVDAQCFGELYTNS
jgi:hypothetical protein